MSDISSNNKRIAKNTLALYFRTFFSLLVSLYTSRIILNELGVTDYGIYNVVGGFVGMFTILSSSLSGAISRFLTFELGKGNIDKLNKIFCTSVNIQIILSILIVIVSETFGLWFLTEKMNIDPSRMFAAKCVFHTSVIVLVLDLITIPYNAIIVAHEHMKAFAYLGITHTLLKLVIVLLLPFFFFDKLIIYSVLLLVTYVIIRILNGIYCKHHFSETNWHIYIDKSLMKEMFTFSGWTFIGSSSAILRDQGSNILLNLYVGPVINAARGIAEQVNGAINSFASNFMTAVNPQITKSYAANDKAYMLELIYKSAKFSLYLLLFLSLPIIVETPYILKIWLKVVPEHTVWFVRLILLYALCDSASRPLITAILATGNIKNYQLIIGAFQFLCLPISYFFLERGFYPEITLIVSLILNLCCLVVRLILLRSMIGLRVRIYIKEVVIKVVLIGIVSSALPIYLSFRLPNSFSSFIVVIVLTLVITLLSIYCIGCSSSERYTLKKALFKLYKNLLGR
ncbi:oligosaccharide flippase family protein [uncultured Prevotella sp.]|jgi:polysaccharide biosynthesis protein|uniref:oligosaccharide flippase family protein n=1 Tax=uncultured Prevotella sp. TaxID=159272 RepID=UPI00259B474C|nr:oligosaccharide flippase family protein [uncultured Prevotella sp.]